MKVTNSIKQKWAEMLMGDFSPHGIALGLAVGTFIALLPSFGFSALLALGFIFIFPKINRPTVFIAIMIWNPVVQIPIYAISYQLGSILFEGMTVIEYNFEVLNQIYSFTRRF
ncbi:DUF2062 domain-containing protein, partial [Candidatus Kaiserbacteria bacterium]|nr:DUF2062 domain-containing protein [Candidatus Kaiserbacteria bacterium]